MHGKRISVELIVRVLACLAEGLGIRATARVFEVDPSTVLRWLVEAVEQLWAFAGYFLCNVHVNQLQLDELYAVLRGVHEGVINADNAIKRLERSRHWVWTAMDPQSKLLLAIALGPRTLAMTQRVVYQVVDMLATGCVPLCLTDGLKDYGTALLTHFGAWMQPERRQAKGMRPHPRWIPLPELLYAPLEPHAGSLYHALLTAPDPRTVYAAQTSPAGASPKGPPAKRAPGVMEQGNPPPTAGSWPTGAPPTRWRRLAANSLGVLLGVLVAWALLAAGMPLVIAVYRPAQCIVHLVLNGIYRPGDDMAFFVVFLLYSPPFVLAGILPMQGRFKWALAIVVGIVGASVTLVIVVLLMGGVRLSF